ncbi:MAG: diguanylate cyclase [Gemmatimonadaceae bacterium]
MTPTVKTPQETRAKQAQDETIEVLRAALQKMETELHRVREEAQNRGHLVDILHEVMGNLSSDEIFHMLTRRLARALDLSQASVVLAKAGDKMGMVATAFEAPSLENLEIRVDRYPEIAAALHDQRPVLIRDIHNSPWYTELRKRWEQEGVHVSVKSVIALPFYLDDDTSGVFLLRRDNSKAEFDEADVEFSNTVVGSALAAIRRAHAVELTRADNVRLEVLAHTDSLTQLLNRRALTLRLVAEMDRVRRYDSMLSLLMVDLDYFKFMNDTYGHLAGDEVLHEVAALLQRSARTVDFVARYGGEEFVVVLPETTSAGATAFAERVRERIERHSFLGTDRGGAKLTTSIGVATFPSPGVDTVETLFARADEALYRAKEQGRNRVCV